MYKHNLEIKRINFSETRHMLGHMAVLRHKLVITSDKRGEDARFARDVFSFLWNY